METETIKATETNSIKLTRGQRGGYGFEIKVVGDSDGEMISRLKKIDTELKSSFIQPTKFEEEN